MNKIIFISGSSTGIGATTATLLAPGNTVIIHYRRSEPEAVKVGEAVSQQGGKAFLIQADLSHDEGCIKVADFIQQEFGKLDVLINNAGGLDSRHSAKTSTWELIERIFRLNAFSVMRLSSLCIPLLEKATHPCIVNISSLAARTGGPNATVYAAAKGAIDTLTRGLAKELAPHIRVNAIAPGFIKTPFHDEVTTQEYIQTMKDMTPLKKIGTPKDVADAIKLLVENEFITGESIDVNGGIYMR